MDELNFRRWLSDRGVTAKVQSDTISRLKRIERELGPVDIDEAYGRDQCAALLGAFAKRGRNDLMASYEHTALPIGSLSMNAYKHALKQYVDFKNDLVSL